MNWEAIGAMGEIVGATAVVATLVYLAIQTKQSTEATNRATTQSILEGRAAATQFLAADQELSDILWRGARNPDDLTEKEWNRFVLAVTAVSRPIELAFLDYSSGWMTDDLWSAQHETILFWFRTPGYRRWWDFYGVTFHPAFRAYIDAIQHGAQPGDEGSLIGRQEV